MPLFDRLLRAGETKLVKRLARIAQHIETLEPEVQELSDAALRAKTAEFVLRHRGRWSAEVEKRLLAGEALVVDELPDDGSATTRPSRWTSCSPRRSPWSARPRSARSASARSPCS